MIFPYHIYCAQSKVKWGVGWQWGAHGVNGGHGPQALHSYATGGGGRVTLSQSKFILDILAILTIFNYINKINFL